MYVPSGSSNETLIGFEQQLHARNSVVSIHAIARLISKITPRENILYANPLDSL